MDRGIQPRRLEIVLQEFRFVEIRHADRLRGAAFEGGAGSETYELGALDRDATARGIRGDRIIGLPDAGAPMVEKIHRDLDEPAALERQAEGLDKRKAP